MKTCAPIIRLACRVMAVSQRQPVNPFSGVHGYNSQGGKPAYRCNVPTARSRLDPAAISIRGASDAKIIPESPSNGPPPPSVTRRKRVNTELPFGGLRHDSGSGCLTAPNSFCLRATFTASSSGASTTTPATYSGCRRVRDWTGLTRITPNPRAACPDDRADHPPQDNGI